MFLCCSHNEYSDISFGLLLFIYSPSKRKKNYNVTHTLLNFFHIVSKFNITPCNRIRTKLKCRWNPITYPIVVALTSHRPLNLHPQVVDFVAWILPASHNCVESHPMLKYNEKSSEFRLANRAEYSLFQKCSSSNLHGNIIMYSYTWHITHWMINLSRYLCNGTDENYSEIFFLNLYDWRNIYKLFSELDTFNTLFWRLTSTTLKSYFPSVFGNLILFL